MKGGRKMKPVVVNTKEGTIKIGDHTFAAEIFEYFHQAANEGTLFRFVSGEDGVVKIDVVRQREGWAMLPPGMLGVDN